MISFVLPLINKNMFIYTIVFFSRNRCNAKFALYTPNVLLRSSIISHTPIKNRQNSNETTFTRTTNKI